MSETIENAVVKIAVIGLNNAGKTTLIRTLQHELKAGESLAPTRQVERNQFDLFGQSGSIWDYGGQAQYRETYCAKPERFFADIRYMFFVFDVQESSTLPDALEYFKVSYEHVKSLSKNVLVTVLFNKMDPHMIDVPEYKQRIEMVTKECQKIVEDGEIGFYNTSVYDPPSVLTAFSRPILGDLPIYNIISMNMANFAMAYGLVYLNLLINNFELGSFQLKDGKQNFVSAAMQFYQQFKEWEEEPPSRQYTFEGYAFQLLRGKFGKLKYTLNLASPITGDAPKVSEVIIRDFLSQIEAEYARNPPKIAL
jgi:GTPase SAR1 family protein